jgi:hypothetical protein
MFQSGCWRCLEFALWVGGRNRYVLDCCLFEASRSMPVTWKRLSYCEFVSPFNQNPFKSILKPNQAANSKKIYETQLLFVKSQILAFDFNHSQFLTIDDRAIWSFLHVRSFWSAQRCSRPRNDRSLFPELIPRFPDVATGMKCPEITLIPCAIELKSNKIIDFRLLFPVYF